MKKIISLGLVSMMAITGAMADEYTFEPVEISATTPASAPATSAPSKVITAQDTDAKILKSNVVSTEQNERFQNALLELDSVQVDIRDKLLDLKTQYTEIDAEYNKYKTQRAAMKKTIKAAEKRIKNIDKFKKNIRKDMI